MRAGPGLFQQISNLASDPLPTPICYTAAMSKHQAPHTDTTTWTVVAIFEIILIIILIVGSGILGLVAWLLHPGTTPIDLVLTYWYVSVPLALALLVLLIALYRTTVRAPQAPPPNEG